MNREQYKNKLRQHAVVEPRILQSPLTELATASTEEFIHQLQEHQTKQKKKLRDV